MAEVDSTPINSPVHPRASSFNIPSSPLLPLDLRASPPKRPPSSSTLDLEIRKRLKNNEKRLRSTRLISYAMTSRVGAFDTPSARATAALDYAKALDAQLGLSSDGTQVQIRDEAPPSSQSEIYDHENPSQWEVDEFRRSGIEGQVSLAYRCFLDGFFHECGYKPRWHPDIRQKEPNLQNLAFKTQGQCVAESRDMLAAAGIIHKDLQFLVGKKNPYQEFQSYVHDLRVPVVAATLSQICRRPSCSSSREATYKKIWYWLTGYHEFKDAIGDCRYMGTAGVTYDEDWEDEEDIEESDFWSKVERTDWD